MHQRNDPRGKYRRRPRPLREARHELREARLHGRRRREAQRPRGALRQRRQRLDAVSHALLRALADDARPRRRRVGLVDDAERRRAFYTQTDHDAPVPGRLGARAAEEVPRAVERIDVPMSCAAALLSPPRTIHDPAAASPRLVSAERPRPSRRRRRDSSPRTRPRPSRSDAPPRNISTSQPAASPLRIRDIIRAAKTPRAVAVRRAFAALLGDDAVARERFP